MLKEKNYENMDLLFPIFAVVTNRCTRKRYQIFFGEKAVLLFWANEHIE